jgi:hypothetical protein
MNEFFEMFESFKKRKAIDNPMSTGKANAGDNDNLNKFFKYFSKTKLMDPEGDSKTVTYLEQEINILKQECQAKQIHNERLIEEIQEFKKKLELSVESAIDFQKNSQIAYEQELENHVLAFDILRVRIRMK